MKKLLKMLGLTLALVAIMTVAIAGTVSASSGPMGPAPNSGDGVSDGSGFEVANGPNAEVGLGTGPVGPAPNSGDGIPDGSGF
jgi:hypothetical protein